MAHMVITPLLTGSPAGFAMSELMFRAPETPNRPESYTCATVPDTIIKPKKVESTGFRF